MYIDWLISFIIWLVIQKSPAEPRDWGSAVAILAVLSFLVVVSASLLYLVESDRCEERGLPCSGFETERKKRVEMNSGINSFSS